MRKNIVLDIAAILLLWFANSQKPAIASVAVVNPPQNVMVPPLAYDDSSITVIWSKPADYSNVVGYNVYQDGTLAGNTKNLFFDITGLEPNSPYSITVKALDAAGTESLPGNKIIQVTAPAMKVFNVTAFGAVGDGKTLNTAAIQKAIDECTENGRVLISDGTFLSGALFLKSNMTLQIDGTLRGSDNPSDYPLTSKRFPYYLSGNNFMGLLNAYTENYGSITNVRICGRGTVNGSSDTIGSVKGHEITILGKNQVAASGGDDSDRADMLTIKGVDGLYIQGLNFVNPAMHTIFISYSRNITVNGINVSTYDIHNADGINICTSDTAYLFNSTFDTGDDCINFNAGVGADGVKDNYPDNNIRVFNCTTKRGHGGAAFGSFTAAWIQNVLIEDCVFDGTDIGLRFKTNKANGGGARNVLCRDITIKNIAKDAAVFFDSAYAHTPSQYPSAGPGQFRDITIKNITCSGIKKYGIYVSGAPQMPHSNLSLCNISIDSASLGGAYVKYCTESTFDAVNIKNASPPWIIDADSVSGLNFKNCSPMPELLSEPAQKPLAPQHAAAPVLPEGKIVRFVIVGDTTAKENKGWGPGFAAFLTDRTECTNMAVGGRSSKKFIEEGRWDKALALKGDYYLIQFGHNDESAKDDSGTDPNTSYRDFMKKFIDDTLALGAKPVLVTSMVRRQWDSADPNKINSSLAPYADAVRKLAAENNVPLVDLHERSRQLCEKLGKEKCDGLSPLKDDGRIDNTHLNSKGSAAFARLIIDELVKVAPELAPCFNNAADDVDVSSPKTQNDE